MGKKANLLRLKNLEETKQFGREIAGKIKGGAVVCLEGDLGAGKTTLTKAIAAELGIDAFKVKSPSYTYFRKYKLDGRNLYHIDLYRITEFDDLMQHEMEELFEEKGAIIIIEWPNRIEELLPEKRITIKLKHLNEHEREVEYSF